MMKKKIAVRATGSKKGKKGKKAFAFFFALFCCPSAVAAQAQLLPKRSALFTSALCVQHQTTCTS
jgi:hypothetical protein